MLHSKFQGRDDNVNFDLKNNRNPSFNNLQLTFVDVAVASLPRTYVLRVM